MGAAIRNELGTVDLDAWDVTPLLKVGMRVQAFKKIDLAPYATISVGERGTVVWADSFGVDIKMDVVHPGLHHWHNCISLNTPEGGGDTSAIARSLVRIPHTNTEEEQCDDTDVFSIHDARAVRCRSS